MKLGGFLQGLEGRGPTRLPEAVRKGWPQVDQGWPHVGTDQGSVPGSTQGCRLLPGPHQASPDAQTEHCGAQPTVTRGWAGGRPQRLPTLPCCLPRFLEPSPAREARPAGVCLSVCPYPARSAHPLHGPSKEGFRGLPCGDVCSWERGPLPAPPPTHWAPKGQAGLLPRPASPLRPGALRPASGWSLILYTLSPCQFVFSFH